jgi:hypothetical protein
MIDADMESASWVELGLEDPKAIEVLNDKWILVSAPNEAGKHEIIGGGFGKDARFTSRWSAIPVEWPTKGRKLMVVDEDLHFVVKRTMMMLITVTVEAVGQIEMMRDVVVSALANMQPAGLNPDNLGENLVVGEE